MSKGPKTKITLGQKLNDSQYIDWENGGKPFEVHNVIDLGGGFVIDVNDNEIKWFLNTDDDNQ